MRKLILVTSAVLAAGLGVAAHADAQTTPSCTGGQLKIAHTRPQGATGHGNFVVVYRNVSKATCSLTGYPGLDAIGPRGRVMAHAHRTLNGYTGGAHAVRTVVLRPGRLASADVEWENVSSHGGNCLHSASVATTPANTARTVRFPLSVSLCALQVHPTVAGPTGNG